MFYVAYVANNCFCLLKNSFFLPRFFQNLPDSELRDSCNQVQRHRFVERKLNRTFARFVARKFFLEGFASGRRGVKPDVIFEPGEINQIGFMKPERRNPVTDGLFRVGCDLFDSRPHLFQNRLHFFRKPGDVLVNVGGFCLCHGGFFCLKNKVDYQLLSTLINLRFWVIITHHPLHAKLVGQHSEIRTPKRVRHWHKNLTARRQAVEKMVGLFLAVGCDVDIEKIALHTCSERGRAVAAHQHTMLANWQRDVQDFVRVGAFHVGRAGWYVAETREAVKLTAEHEFVQIEGLFAGAVEVEVGIEKWHSCVNFEMKLF